MTTNNITGDVIKTKPANDAFLEGWERIFGKVTDNKTPEDMVNDEFKVMCKESDEWTSEHMTNCPHFLKDQAC